MQDEAFEGGAMVMARVFPSSENGSRTTGKRAPGIQFRSRFHLSGSGIAAAGLSRPRCPAVPRAGGHVPVHRICCL